MFKTCVFWQGSFEGLKEYSIVLYKVVFVKRLLQLTLFKVKQVGEYLPSHFKVHSCIVWRRHIIIKLKTMLYVESPFLYYWYVLFWNQGMYCSIHLQTTIFSYWGVDDISVLENTSTTIPSHSEAPGQINSNYTYFKNRPRNNENQNK